MWFTFIDNHTRVFWVYVLKDKLDVSFAHVAKINTVRVLLSLAANLD